MCLEGCHALQNCGMNPHQRNVKAWTTSFFVSTKVTCWDACLAVPPPSQTGVEPFTQINILYMIVLCPCVSLPLSVADFAANSSSFKFFQFWPHIYNHLLLSTLTTFLTINHTTTTASSKLFYPKKDHCRQPSHVCIILWGVASIHWFHISS